MEDIDAEFPVLLKYREHFGTKRVRTDSQGTCEANLWTRNLPPSKRCLLFGAMSFYSQSLWEFLPAGKQSREKRILIFAGVYSNLLKHHNEAEQRTLP